MKKEKLTPEEELAKQEENLSSDDDSATIPPNDIVAYNEQRSCADILRMFQTKQLEIGPDFQRGIVWETPAQTRFIDSLSKQLPIPSLCISLDYKTNKRIVIDGLQRITSIVKFLSDDEWKLSDIDDVDDKIAGKTVHTIKTKSSKIYERVQNVTIPVTVLRCDFSNEAHNEYLFMIFHRLNTGGVKLNNQEIRNCIYNGVFNSFLKKLASSKEWFKLLSLKKDLNYRFAQEEIILRFFAFYDTLDEYNGKLAKYLNKYMEKNRHLDEKLLQQKEELFKNTVKIIQDNISEEKEISQMSKAVLEGLMIGVAKNIETLKNPVKEKVIEHYNKFSNLDEFSINNLKEGLSSTDKVKSRLESAIKAFKND